ncbi:MAG: hypothetical protein Q8934_14580 [Bacillota bacterium]|nr:hypothetical protein [Bacillota bacterium]
MDHIFYNHIVTGLLILIIGLFIMAISIFYIYLEFKERKNESIISVVLDNVFGFLLGSGPTGMTLGLYFSLIVIVIGGWVLFYGSNHV